MSNFDLNVLNKCHLKTLFKRPKAKELIIKPFVDLKSQMSCFDRDHRVVVQRRTANSSAFVGKNGRPGTAPVVPSLDLESKNGASSFSSIPRVSKSNANSAIRLKNLKQKMHESDLSADQKVDLDLEYADCLCNLGRFREAATIYARVFSGSNRNKIPFDRLKHFIRTLTKITIESVANSGVSLFKVESESSESKKETLLFLPGQTCPDPFSCPLCAGILCEPISLPCGHTFCRKCIAKTPSLQRACLKCGAGWRPVDCLLPTESETSESDVINHLKPNVLICKLVQRYWTNELKAVNLKSEANSYQQKGSHEKAVELYTKALELAPNDYFLFGNRSLTYHKLGRFELSLEDAIKATEVKPDWAKGYFRKGAALQSLGRHEEAFQAFYECLTLEEDKSSKPIKNELSKELYSLLSSELDSPPERTFATDDSECSSSGGAMGYENMELDETAKIIPLSMVALVEFASAVTSQVTTPAASTLPRWMARGVTPYRIKARSIADTAVIDPQDYECPLCIQVMVSPVTTPCGHTFCRRCLDRSLDHSPVCPLCKSPTLNTYLAERRDAINEFVNECMKRLIPVEYTEREKIVTAELMELAGIPDILAEPANLVNFEEADSSPEVPIFVCTISFPNVRCPLHIFEPRYRLMIRRTMEIGTRQFGMTSRLPNELQYCDYGTMLEIRDIQVLRDGRSVIDTRGRRRFKIIERRIRDGYNVAAVEFLKDDVVLEDQLQELKQLHDETYKKTQAWFETISFDMRSRFENHYGDMPQVENEYWEMPNGPAWHWWTIAILPLDPASQVHVLSLTSLKRRLETIVRILKHLETKNP